MTKNSTKTVAIANLAAAAALAGATAPAHDIAKATEPQPTRLPKNTAAKVEETNKRAPLPTANPNPPEAKSKPQISASQLAKFTTETLTYCKTRPDFAPALAVPADRVREVIAKSNPTTLMGAKRAVSRFVRVLIAEAAAKAIAAETPAPAAKPDAADGVDLGGELELA